MNSGEALYLLTKISSEKPDYVYKRLYRHFYNPDFYVRAYDLLHAKEDQVAGRGGNGAVRPRIEDINGIIERMRDESYQPQPVNRAGGANKNSKPEFLVTSAYADRLIVEICRLLLTAIYEPLFEDSSHGFRPNRSCHTALQEAKLHFKDAPWLIQGEIRGYCTDFSRHKLISLLQDKIDDAKFIRLIWKLLRAGYLEDWKHGRTYSGTPLGGALSSVLANIYWHPFDQWISSNPSPGPGRIHCIRYGDTFVTAVWGSKESCTALAAEMKAFISRELKLPGGVTQVAHASVGVCFLGHILRLKNGWNSQTGFKNAYSTDRGTIELYMPQDTVRRFISKHKLVKNIDDKSWRMLHAPALLHRPDAQIVAWYNVRLRGLYHFYQMAVNVSTYLQQLSYVMEYSCLATLAHKYQSSTSRVKEKLKEGRSWGVPVQSRNGERRVLYFHRGGFPRTHSPYLAADPDLDPGWSDAAR
ncbi:group II intron reverse transcriptase/maturase [Paenibacillus sp. JSM ZJ436]|uniref:reverse transcriptase/maturase family protein n=1 Tax=Paenibacillus sp. JSM ZJ436 TaxID=3376190 RepID=UPI0037BCEF79